MQSQPKLFAAGLAWKHPLPGYRLATSRVYYTTSCNTQSSAPEDGRNPRPKPVELIEVINKPLLLHLVGVYIIFYQQFLALKTIFILLHTHIMQTGRHRINNFSLQLAFKVVGEVRAGIWWGNLKGPYGRYGHRWVNNIQMDIQEIGTDTWSAWI